MPGVLVSSLLICQVAAPVLIGRGCSFLIRLRIANRGITDNELFAPNITASKLRSASNNSLTHTDGMGRD